MVVGLAVQAESWAAAGKLLLIWFLVLLAGASVAHLVAQRALQRGHRAVATIALCKGHSMSCWDWAYCGLAWRMLVCPDLFRAIMLFISFGLLLALVWVRLDAPDVALAEAAIGAGLTAPCFWPPGENALVAERKRRRSDKRTKRRHLRWLPVTVLLPLLLDSGYVVLSLPPDAAGLSAQVAANLQTSGVSNPVTAVLLNFRGYDTLLEMVVLLLALLGVWSLEGRPAHARLRRDLCWTP